MATKKPRLTITLDPDLSESLRRLSELTGNSQSSLISEMLSGSGPVLEKMITVLEAAQVAKDAIKGRITRGLDDAQGKFEQALGLAFDGFDDIDAALKQMAEAAPERQTPTASASAAKRFMGLLRRVCRKPAHLGGRGRPWQGRPGLASALRRKQKREASCLP